MSKTYAFQGAPGAYSQLASLRLSGDPQVRTLPCEGFIDVFAAVESGRAEYGVLPVENALTGSIHDNFDLYLQFPHVEIIAEYRLRIQHNLIGMPGTDMAQVREVYSHIQGLLQCSRYLDSYPSWKRVPHYDTAGSVAFVAELGDKTKVAIASALAAELYGMEILVPGIETNDRNYTRFAMIRDSRHLGVPRPEGMVAKGTVVFGLSDRPGSLLDALKTFADRGLNLKKIESRPIHGKPFEYMFYVDVELPEGGVELLHAAAHDLARDHEFVRILGHYPVAGDV